MTQHQGQEIRGGCYCGAVRFSLARGTKPVELVGTPPVGTAYCHCRDCQQAHAAPLYQVAFVSRGDFQVTDGVGLLDWYTRTESKRNTLQRYFCRRCGSKVFNHLTPQFGDSAGIEITCVFPSLFDDQRISKSDPWVPKCHIRCSEAIIDLSAFADSLPREG